MSHPDDRAQWPQLERTMALARFAVLLSTGLGPLAGVAAGAAEAPEFYAHWTRVAGDPELERYSRTGDLADVAVRVGAAGGRLVFSRATSYLPVWETDLGRFPFREIVPRRGDGPPGRPDRVNTYSHVRIVESSADRALIHWRYLPDFGGTNPHTGLSPTRFVDEDFDVRADGRVVRTVRRGTEKYRDWLDPRNRWIEELELSPDGVRRTRLDEPRRSPPPPRVVGSPVVGGEVGRPVVVLRLDEGEGDVTREEASGTVLPVEGRSTLWRRGVSGSALELDGYTTAVRLEAPAGPGLGGGVTLEGWLAIGAYPWNWAPVVELGDDGRLFLGVDAHGHPGVRLRVGEAWREVVGETSLELRRWVHLAGTFDPAAGTLALWVDGAAAGSEDARGTALGAERLAVRVGKGQPMRPADPVRASTFVASYAFDGLLDEVRVHDRPLRPAEIADSARRMRPAGDLVAAPDLPRRRLPATDLGRDFAARFTRLAFHEGWDSLWRFDEHADLVVTFDESPCRFVFWRGMGYIPALVNERDQWYSNEFNETWGRSGGQGCQEPMSDKEAYSNRVCVLESSPARIVVLWRYPLKDVLHVHANYRQDTGWSDWSDWRYTIYPDGVAVKRMRLWTDGPRNHEWHEAMAILGPGQHPEQVLETKPALVLAGLDGAAEEVSWVGGPPRAPSFREKRVHVVDYKADHDPFTIGEFVDGDIYSGEVTPYSVFPTWNHWPVAQIPSDGRYASFPDRTAHCSLTHVRLPDWSSSEGERPYQEKLLLEGMSARSPAELAGLARSWLDAPSLEGLAGGAGGAYDPAERAWVVAARSPRVSFRIQASPERPILNPCFVVRNWGGDAPAAVEVDGAPLAAGPGLRQGIVRDAAGLRQLVVWLRLEATRPVELAISGAVPRDLSADGIGLEWSTEPRQVEGALAVEMEAAPPLLPGPIEYLFERAELGADGRSPGIAWVSGWVDAPRWVDAGLRPGTRYAYQVRARTAYFEETGSSIRVEVTTAPAPPPAVWALDEESGAAASDSGGRCPGEVQGPAVRVRGRRGRALRLDGSGFVRIASPERLPTSGDFTWAAWVRTERGGAIVSRAGRGESWTPGGKVLFIAGGRAAFDVGWVGEVRSDGPRVDDGTWHHVAVSVGGSKPASVRLFVDGKPAGGGTLDVGAHPETGLPLKIGHCNADFPRGGAGFVGEIDDVRWYGQALDEADVAELCRGPGE